MKKIGQKSIILGIILISALFVRCNNRKIEGKESLDEDTLYGLYTSKIGKYMDAYIYKYPLAEDDTTIIRPNDNGGYIITLHREPMPDSVFIVSNVDSISYLFLQTALQITEQALRQYPESMIFIFKKLQILCEQQKYDEAVSFIGTKNLDNYSGDATYPYKEVLINHFYAMKAEMNNNTKELQDRVKRNISLIDSYIRTNRDSLNEFINRFDKNIIKGTYTIALPQYYFYYAALYGRDEAELLVREAKYDDLLTNYIISIVRDDFMTFSMF